VGWDPDSEATIIKVDMPSTTSSAFAIFGTAEMFWPDVAPMHLLPGNRRSKAAQEMG
jgi:hypothetical protein